MVVDLNSIPPALTDGTLITAGIGALLLAFGRRLYFLVLGVVGFGLGLWASQTAAVASLGLTESPESQLVMGLVLGVVAASLAFVVHRMALTVGGLGAGAFGGLYLAEQAFGGLQGWGWAVVVGGAVLGAVLLHRLFDLALVLLSSWVGAGLVSQVLPLEGPVAVVAVLGLIATGILLQTRGRSKGEKRPKRKKRRERRQAPVVEPT